MKRKMALLEQAHGLLCNVPGDGGSAEDGEEWHRLRAEWIERWSHVIRDDATKDHNRRIAIGNEAIARYDRGGHVRSGRVANLDMDKPEPVEGPQPRRIGED